MSARPAAAARPIEMPSPRAIAAFTALAATVPLAWGAVSGPHLFDAGELVAAGARLGAGHAPGQPLHAILAYAATLLPLGPMPWRIALLSVACGGIAAYEAGAIVGDAIARAGGAVRTVARILPAVAAIAVLLAPAVAPQLARPEVYTLALALALGGARRLIAWACRDRGAASALRVAAGCAGLAVAVHPPHALALLAIGLVLLLGWRRDALGRPRALGWAAIACVVGLAAIVYLPIRAAAGAPTWGDPTTASGLFDYLSGAAYQRNLGPRGGSTVANVLEVGAYVLVAAGGAIAIAIGAALASRPRGDGAAVATRSRLGVITAAAAASSIAACLQPLERANPDNVAYAATSIALLVALGGAALAALAGPTPDARREVEESDDRRGDDSDDDSRGERRDASGVERATPARRVPGWAIGAGAALLALAPLPETDLDAALRADLPQLEPLAFALRDVPPPRALVVVRSDFAAAAWMEARAVEGARPDVALLIEGLSTSSWHWRTLAPHPLFDGGPVRAGAGTGYAPWIRGATERALGRVAVVAESDGPTAGRGAVAGPYLVVLPDGRAPARLARAHGERTAGAAGRMLRWAPTSFDGLGHGVVREHELARASRLLARDRAALAITALRRASAPLPERATAPADDVLGSPRRAPPPVVEDPDAIFATAEDAVRALSTVLVALGEPARAVALLEAQEARGDDRALLQLAWIQSEDGLVEPARAALARYLELHPDRQVETVALAARLR